MSTETRSYFGGGLYSGLNIVATVNPHGEYDNAHIYVPGDSVSYLGSSYVAKENTVGNLPTDTSYWQLLSQGVADYIPSVTTTGEHKVTNIKMDADEKIVVQYESAAHP